jgi:hypothetical protein
MVRKSTIGLGVAIVLSTALAATAATKHPARHHRAAVEPANAYGYLNEGTGPQVAEPDYMAIQSEDLRRQY